MGDTNVFQTIFRTLFEGEGAREAKKTMAEVNDITKQLIGTSLKQIATWATVGVAIKKVADYARDSRDKFMDLAESVERVSLSTGMTYEESSRLLEVMGDLRIEQETYLTVLDQAQKKGFNPTIENLAKLADRYNELSDAQERSKLLTDTLGRGGAELVKLFQLTGAEIRTQTSAVNANLVLTEKQIGAYQKAIDAENELGDTTDGTALRVGEATAGITAFLDNLGNQVLIAVGNAYENTAAKADVYAGKLDTTTQKIAMQSTSFEDYIANLKEAAKLAGKTSWVDATHLRIQAQMAEEAGETAYYRLKEFEGVQRLQALIDSGALAPKAGPILDAAAALDEFAAASVATAEFAIKGSLTEAVEKSGQKMEDLKEKHAELTEELARTNTWSTRYKELKEDLEDNEQAQRNLAISLKQTTKEIIYQQAAAGLDAKAALTLARQMGLLDEANYDVGMAIQDARDEMDSGKISEEEYAERIDLINVAWQNYLDMPDYERKVIQFDEYYNKYYGNYTPLVNPMGTSPMGKTFFADEELGGARGLDMMVPAGYPNDSYRLPLKVSSGERVQVLTPEQQASSGAGTSIYGDIYISAQDGDTLDSLMADISRRRG